jgi:hypothetical protein
MRIRNYMTAEPRLISAEIFEALATRRPARTLEEQSLQKKRMEQAEGMRATDLLGQPVGSRTA